MRGPEGGDDPLLAAIAELRDEIERVVGRPVRRVEPAPTSPAPASEPAGDPWGRLDALARHLDGRLKRARGPGG
ncbi:MAG TPA: hypothetical protein VG406_14625 [Isosphaeraceae bacterium]|jgi:hypothetical protein|nr:hypothetical protein [Isosphaeraceae bacterium]